MQHSHVNVAELIQSIINDTEFETGDSAAIRFESPQSPVEDLWTLHSWVTRSRISSAMLLNTVVGISVSTWCRHPGQAKITISDGGENRGFGLGLPIAKRCIETLGESIWTKNDPSGGLSISSAFHFGYDLWRSTQATHDGIMATINLLGMRYVVCTRLVLVWHVCLGMRHYHASISEQSRARNEQLLGIQRRRR